MEKLLFVVCINIFDIWAKFLINWNSPKNLYRFNKDLMTLFVVNVIDLDLRFYLNIF